MTLSLVGTLPVAALLVGVGAVLTFLRAERGEGPLWLGFVAVAVASFGLTRSGAVPAQFGFVSDGVAFFQVVVCIASAGAIVLVAYGRLERPTRTCGWLLICAGALVLLAGATTLAAACVGVVATVASLVGLVGREWLGRLVGVASVLVLGVGLLAAATESAGAAPLGTLALPGSDDATSLALACAVLTAGGILCALMLASVVAHSSAPVAAFVGTAPAVAGVALALRLRLALGVFEPLLEGSLGSGWSVWLAFGAAGLAVVGYFSAFRTRSLQHVAAGLGLAQVALLGLALAGSDGTALAFGSLALVVTQLTLFALVAVTHAELGGSNFERLHGLGRRNPWLGGFLALGLASGIGFPATAGFVAELHLLSAAFGAKLLLPAAIALVALTLGAAAVIRVLRRVYFVPPVEPEGLEPLVTSSGLTIVCAAFAATILWLGLSPAGLVGFTHHLNLLAGQQ